MHRSFLSLIITLLLVHTSLPLPTIYAAPETDRSTHRITLAGLQVEIDLPVDAPDFIQPEADDALQVTTAVRWEPFFEVSLEAFPVQTGLSAAAQAEFEQTLRSTRAAQAARPLASHRIAFFSSQIDSFSNLVEIPLFSSTPEPVIIHEWVTHAHDTQWFFRVSYTPGQEFDERLLDQIEVRGVAAGEAGARATGEPAPAAQAEPAAGSGPGLTPQLEANLPAAGWWQGDCDTLHYQSVAGRPAYPLGGSYRGVKACGPRPVADGAPDVLVRFYPGAWGALEWECVELSLRYLYLAYNVPPYSGHGKDLVYNYQGARLVKIYNGTPGKAPRPGDVLSYGANTAFGHTSVVSASNVDASGNGTITVIEQNSSATGMKTHTVKSWYVQATMTVIGWLHPAEPPGTPGNLSASVISGNRVSLTWGASADPSVEGYRIYRNGAAIAAVSQATTSYIDPSPVCQKNNYYVTSFRDETESIPTATVPVQVNVQCRLYLPAIRAR